MPTFLLRRSVPLVAACSLGEFFSDRTRHTAIREMNTEGAEDTEHSECDGDFRTEVSEHALRTCAGKVDERGEPCPEDQKDVRTKLENYRRLSSANSALSIDCCVEGRLGAGSELDT